MTRFKVNAIHMKKDDIFLTLIKYSNFLTDWHCLDVLRQEIMTRKCKIKEAGKKWIEVIRVDIVRDKEE